MSAAERADVWVLVEVGWSESLGSVQDTVAGVFASSDAAMASVAGSHWEDKSGLGFVSWGEFNEPDRWLRPYEVKR